MSNVDTSSWKEFKLSDIGFLNYHGSRLTKVDRVPGNIVFLTAGKENQGVACKIGNDVQLYKDVITIDMFGNCFYHDEECAGDDNIYFFVNDNISKRIKLFLVSCLTKKLQQKYSYGHQFRQIDADALTIKLPYKEVEEPDWQFMEDYISQLEAERISQLEAYLKVTGLDDYELTDEDREVLGREVEMREFKLKDIFNIKKVYGLSIKSYNIGKIPYVTGSQDNNGIIGYVNAPLEAISKGGCLTVDPIKGFTRFMPMDFVGRGFSGASINLLYNNQLNELNALYMCTAIEKISKSVASYTNLFNSDRLANATILLPVIQNSNPNHKYTINDINFDYMEKYIRAIEKQTIANVYESKGKIIEKTREIVENNNE